MSFTEFKEATANNPGSAVRFGSNDLKEVMQILNGKVVASRQPRILNTWLWLDHFDMKPPGVAPSPPTETNSSRFYVDPSDNKAKIKKTGGTVIDLENVNIPDSALATITDKAKLNSNILYKDQNNDLGDFYLDFGDISVPANPAAGKRRLFFDQATGKLSVRTSAGTTIDLEAVGGGGGGDVSTTATNTFGDFDNTFRSGRLDLRNPANTFSYSFVGSAITGGRNITLPLLTGTDTVVVEALPQTLTNKTIAAGSNTLTGIVDANTSAHTTTKITTTSKGLLNSAIMYNDQNNDIGDFYLDIGDISTPANPAAGTRRIFHDTVSGHLSARTSGGGTVDLERSFYPDVESGGSVWGLWAGGARQGTGLFSGCAAVGTLTGFQAANTGWNPTTDFATGATTGNTSGFQGFQPTAGGFYTTRDRNFRFKCKVQCDALTNRRIFIGFAGVGPLPAATDSYLATAVPGFGFRYSSTTDTTWKVLRNDAAGSAVVVDTTVTPAANTSDILEIVADNANSRIGWSIDGSAFTYYTTDIPANIAPLNYFMIIETKTAAIQRLRAYYAYMTQVAA